MTAIDPSEIRRLARIAVRQFLRWLQQRGLTA